MKTNDERVDPIGACDGQRGVRVTSITEELSGEKIDVIEWSDDIRRFIATALSPAKAISIEIDEAEKKAVVTVSKEEQSLAIGKGGQNVCLAAKLTGWKIDIVSGGEMVAEADEVGAFTETNIVDETIDEEADAVVKEMNTDTDETPKNMEVEELKIEEESTIAGEVIEETPKVEELSEIESEEK